MKVNFFANYRQVVGAKSIELDLDQSATIQTLIDAIIQRYPPLQSLFLDEAGQLRSHVHIFVNGRDCQFIPGGVGAPVASGDKIDIFPPVAGG